MLLSDKTVCRLSRTAVEQVLSAVMNESNWLKYLVITIILIWPLNYGTNYLCLWIIDKHQPNVVKLIGQVTKPLEEKNKKGCLFLSSLSGNLFPVCVFEMCVNMRRWLLLGVMPRATRRPLDVIIRVCVQPDESFQKIIFKTEQLQSSSLCQTQMCH